MVGEHDWAGDGSGRRTLQSREGSTADWVMSLKCFPLEICGREDRVSTRNLQVNKNVGGFSPDEGPNHARSRSLC